MLAYHTLHVLKDVQIENQDEKNQNTIKHLVHYYIITRSTHFKRQLIESMHEDPLVMLGISPRSHPQILRRKGKARKFGSLCTKAAPGGVHKGAFFGAACVSHYWCSCKNFGHILRAWNDRFWFNSVLNSIQRAKFFFGQNFCICKSLIEIIGK